MRSSAAESALLGGLGVAVYSSSVVAGGRLRVQHPPTTIMTTRPGARFRRVRPEPPPTERDGWLRIVTSCDAPRVGAPRGRAAESAQSCLQLMSQ